MAVGVEIIAEKEKDKVIEVYKEEERKGKRIELKDKDKDACTNDVWVLSGRVPQLIKNLKAESTLKTKKTQDWVFGACMIGPEFKLGVAVLYLFLS